MDKVRNLVDKVGDKLDRKSDNASYDNSSSANYGPHSSNTGNKVDPTVDSDLDGRNNPSSRVGGYGNTQTTDSYGTTGGPGGLGSSDTYGSAGNNPSYDNSSSTNAGPHSSNLLNKADPRVDSDRDGRNDPSSRKGGYGQTQTAGDGYGQSRGPGGLSSTDTDYGSGTTGTYGSTTTGTTGYGSGTTGTTDYGSGTTGTSGYGSGTTGSSGYGSSNTYDNPSSTNAGPHSSNLLNKADPRVDSDRDGRNDPSSRAGGYGNTQDSTTGYGDSTGTTGGYGSSTTTGGGYGDSTTTGGTGYTGTSDSYDNPNSTNAGPHKSNLLNKLDPRVDSDRDGRNDPASRTGGYGETQDGGNYNGGPRY